MKTVLVKMVALCFTFATSAALADSDAVQSCSLDSSTQERIQEIPTQERLAVYNEKNEVVGALHFSPEDGSLHALYLCGANSGYYYAEGNAYEGYVDSVYNDEYDSEVGTFTENGKTVMSLYNVTFVGEPEYADYPPFSAELYFKNPAR